jgi:hypothetical protein
LRSQKGIETGNVSVLVGRAGSSVLVRIAVWIYPQVVFTVMDNNQGSFSFRSRRANVDRSICSWLIKIGLYVSTYNTLESLFPDTR